LFGLLYWYALYPIHAMIFSGMLKILACRAEAASPPAQELESLCI